MSSMGYKGTGRTAQGLFTLTTFTKQTKKYPPVYESMSPDRLSAGTVVS